MSHPSCYLESFYYAIFAYPIWLNQLIVVLLRISTINIEVKKNEWAKWKHKNGSWTIKKTEF